MTRATEAHFQLPPNVRTFHPLECPKGGEHSPDPMTLPERPIDTGRLQQCNKCGVSWQMVAHMHDTAEINMFDTCFCASSEHKIGCWKHVAALDADPNVWMLPPEIVEAIGSLSNTHRVGTIGYPLDLYQAIWYYCFGVVPLAHERKRVKLAVLAGCGGNVLVTRRAQA